MSNEKVLAASFCTGSDTRGQRVNRITLLPRTAWRLNDSFVASFFVASFLLACCFFASLLRWFFCAAQS
jgi:hypothetical protein